MYMYPTVVKYMLTLMYVYLLQQVVDPTEFGYLPLSVSQGRVDGVTGLSDVLHLHTQLSHVVFQTMEIHLHLQQQEHIGQKYEGQTVHTLYMYVYMYMYNAAILGQARSA